MDHHHGPPDHQHDHDHEPDGPLPAYLDPTVADGELSPAELDRRTFLRRTGLAGAGVAATAALSGAMGGAAAASPGPEPGRRLAQRRLPLAVRRPPHPHPVQQRRPVPGARPGQPRQPVRTGLDGDHRPRFGRARQARRGQGQPRHPAGPGRPPGDPGLPGPGVEHPGGRARHGVRRARLERGPRAQAVRERVRRGGHQYRREHAGERGAGHRRAGLPRPGRADPAGRRRAHAGQPPGPQGHRLAARDPQLARPRPAHRGRHGGRAGHQAAGIPAPGGPGGARRVRLLPVGRLVRRLPAGVVPDLRRLRLDDLDGGGLWDSLLAEGKPWWIELGLAGLLQPYARGRDVAGLPRRDGGHPRRPYLGGAWRPRPRSRGPGTGDRRRPERRHPRRSAQGSPRGDGRGEHQGHDGRGTPNFAQFVPRWPGST